MKNKYAQDLNILKMIKSLSKGKCAGCVFNKVGSCAILPILQVGHDDPLSDEDLMNDKFPCKYKILHQDLSDFIIDEFFYCIDSETPPSLTYLNLLCDKINNYKEIKNNENI